MVYTESALEILLSRVGEAWPVGPSPPQPLKPPSETREEVTVFGKVFEQGRGKV